MKVLVKYYDDSWSDDMTAEGYWLTTKKEWEDYIALLQPELFPKEYYFADNSFTLFESLEDYLSGFIVIPVTETIYEILKEQLGTQYGIFPKFNL